MHKTSHRRLKIRTATHGPQAKRHKIRERRPIRIRTLRLVTLTGPGQQHRVADQTYSSIISETTILLEDILACRFRIGARDGEWVFVVQPATIAFAVAFTTVAAVPLAVLVVVGGSAIAIADPQSVAVAVEIPAVFGAGVDRNCVADRPFPHFRKALQGISGDFQ